MIGFLRGVLLQKNPQELLLDVGGVGYRVLVPISTFCRLGDQGAQAQLLIHTHVREDQLVLYGFTTSAELELFEKLIGVSGVGPKVALGVLSGIEDAREIPQGPHGTGPLTGLPRDRPVREHRLQAPPPELADLTGERLLLDVVGAALFMRLTAMSDVSASDRWS